MEALDGSFAQHWHPALLLPKDLKAEKDPPIIKVTPSVWVCTDTSRRQFKPKDPVLAPVAHVRQARVTAFLVRISWIISSP